MVHSGFEATAVRDTVTNPLKAAMVALRGVRTEGDMAPDVRLDQARPAEYMFSQHVEAKLGEIRTAKAAPAADKADMAAAG
jgi:hypothetical protein